MTGTLERPAPTIAHDAERAVLSGILLAHTVPPDVAALLTPAMFAREAHRVFYQAMLAITARGDVVDPLTLMASLNGDLERAGGIEYLASFIDDVPTAEHILAHAKIVRTHAQRRELAALGRQLERAATDPGVDVDAVIRAAAMLVAVTDPAQRFRLLTIEELRAVPARGWVLEQHVPAGGLAVLYGAAGVGKSFVALSQACAIATGAPWFRWATQPGPVVFAAAEGGWGLDRRLRALQDAEGIADLSRLRILPEPVNLLSRGDVDALLASVTATFTDPPALFVFDTLAGSMAGGDENATKDMTLVVDQARRVTRATGAAVYLIHHTGRDETRQKSERGSIALRGGADVMFRLAGEDGGLTLENDKQRDTAPLEPLQLRLYPIAGSCVVQPNEAVPTTGDLTAPERKALEALSSIAIADRGATSSEWLETSVGPEGRKADQSQIGRGTYFRARKRLVELGFVSWDGKAKRYSLTGRGISASVPSPRAVP